MITKAEFSNCLRSLFFIDVDTLPGLLDDEQRRFIRDPVSYFIECSDAQAAAIWREIEKRQEPRKENT